MGWAIFWGIIIASVAGPSPESGGAGFLAFLVIWYFADRANSWQRAGMQVEKNLTERIQQLESALYNPRQQRTYEE